MPSSSRSAPTMAFSRSSIAGSNGRFPEAEGVRGTLKRSDQSFLLPELALQGRILEL
jgi:hypothetical protein